MSIEAQINTALSRIFPFTEEQSRAVIERIIVRTCRRKEFILAPPAVSNFVGLVLQGSFRMYRISSPDNTADARENTLHFFTEGNWLADFDSFVVQRPALNHIQCLEKAELALLSIHDLHALIRENEAFMALGRVMKDWTSSTIHYTSLLNDTPDQRYQLLMQTRPDWMLRFPQIYLASYLGMSRETYSRVRRRHLEASNY